MTIPNRLKIGDTIGICSPSSPVAAHCPKRLKRGIEELKNLGLTFPLIDSNKTYKAMLQFFEKVA
jgi:muramoyltetrapeptide carboxypeptidase LdcA involved in peptidoglycan recycling